jgi:hypothetical protein
MHCSRPPGAACLCRCYMKLYTAGLYKGLGHCLAYEQAMKDALKKKGLVPV